MHKSNSVIAWETMSANQHNWNMIPHFRLTRPKWRRLQNLKRKVVNATKSLALSVLPKSLFYNEENENDDDDQSTDSLNYYVKHSCPGSGLDETTLSEMRERPAVTLRRREQLGAQLGLFKDGRPMSVTLSNAVSSDRKHRFSYMYKDDSAGKEFRDMKEAMNYCGVDQINLPHPQVNKDLVPRMGYNPDEVAAIYQSRNDKEKFSIYNHAGDWFPGWMAIDVLEKGDDSGTVLAMARSKREIFRIIGGGTVKAQDAMKLLENGSHSSVDIRSFSLRIHSPQELFVPGIVPGKEEKLNRLKSFKETATGKYTLFQVSKVDKPHWVRVDDRIRTHASSLSELSRIAQVHYRKVKDVPTISSGEHCTVTNHDGIEFKIYHYDEEEESHGTYFESYDARKKRAAREEAAREKAAVSTKKAAASTKKAAASTKKKAAASTKKKAAASTKKKAAVEDSE